MNIQEAATALETKDKELSALREMAKCKDVEISGAIERSRMLLDAKDYWKARAEIAERRVAELEVENGGLLMISTLYKNATETAERERDEAREALRSILAECDEAPTDNSAWVVAIQKIARTGEKP